ncbi:DUF3592 domain-containing protein [Rhodocytophaga rosea]|uniref:DUF3592 domain-containing protein n=1 Tax=Rhodocytophaga rosea TaxID=2704465 RepID=A0A6C0GHY9_9BACT|nr:DUF3592 domain-containing protein [Rhodocytophaga rosea]QHT67515.1 DUF3592 domain-containing protein [Rhodocytophaga rosea]
MRNRSFNFTQVFGSIFTLVGLVLLTVCVISYYNEQQFLNKAISSSGIVTQLGESRSSKGSSTYYPIVEFTDQTGKKTIFSSSYSSSPPAYEVGETVEVLYEPGKPSQAEIKGFFSQWLAALITGFLGMIFSTIGLANLFAASRTRKKDAWLLNNGRKIETQLQSVAKNTNVRVNGRSPFVVYSQWLNPHTQQVHVFKSASIWYDPSEYISNQKVPVWVDPNNYKRYRVDLSFLPEISN